MYRELPLLMTCEYVVEKGKKPLIGYVPLQHMHRKNCNFIQIFVRKNMMLHMNEMHCISMECTLRKIAFKL